MRFFLCCCLDRIAFFLVIIGVLNWLSIGLLQLDLIAVGFGGSSSIVSRLIYCLIGLATLWLILPKRVALMKEE